MEAITPAPTRHEAASVFVDDHDFGVLYDVGDVAFVEGVSAQKLADAVDVFADIAEVRFGTLLGFLFKGRAYVWTFVDIYENARKVGQDKGIRVIRPQGVASLFGEVSLMLFFIQGVVESFFEFVELLFIEVVVHLDLECFEQSSVGAIFQNTEELLVLRKAEAELKELG